MSFIKSIYRSFKTLSFRMKYRSKNVKIRSGCYVYGKNTVFGGNNVINEKTLFRGSIGYASYIGSNCRINAKIGKYCSIASNVSVVNGFHPTSVCVSTHPAFYSTAKQAGFTYVSEDSYKELRYADGEGHASVIGNDVWIGENALIFAGVKIGDGAIIGAGAVVTSDVGPYSIVGGVPARLIRKRFDDDVIEKLLAQKWWDRPDAWIAEHSSAFMNVNDYLSIIDDTKEN